MAVLDRSELQASSLADLHAVADQLGLDGFRRLRKADLIDAILGEPSKAEDSEQEPSRSSERDSGPSRRRSPRSRRSGASKEQIDETAPSDEDEPKATSSLRRAESSRRPKRTSSSSQGSRQERSGASGRDGSAREKPAARQPSSERTAEGVVELLGNGSAFLRIDPPEPSDEDVYVSAAQVRRCELVSGDRVTGPVRTPRRSERYPSLVRIDTINGAPADSVSEGTRYEDLPVTYASVRLALDSEDPTLKAIEWLTPLGRGSRAVIVGASGAGKTETLRRMLGALAGQDGLETTLVLSGVRPEEVGEWQQGPVAASVALSFAASADSQGHAVEQAVETAKRVAARGGDALVLIDTLDGLHPHTARKALAAARNLSDGGSLTVIGTCARPFGGETTVIALDVALTSTGRLPALDLMSSGTFKPELLVGDEGAAAIVQARAAAVSES